MPYSLLVTGRFEKDLKHLTPADRTRVFRLLDEIVEAPHSFKTLSGSLKGLQSARVGTLRVLYSIDENREAVVLITVRPRERVYE